MAILSDSRSIHLHAPTSAWWGDYWTVDGIARRIGVDIPGSYGVFWLPVMEGSTVPSIKILAANDGDAAQLDCYLYRYKPTVSDGAPSQVGGTINIVFDTVGGCSKYVEAISGEFTLATGYTYYLMFVVYSLSIRVWVQGIDIEIVPRTI